MANSKSINKFGNFLARQFGNLSIGLLILIVWGWMYLRTGDFFPENTEAWRFYIQTWIIFFGFTITLAGTIARNYIGDLFRFSFLKDFWKFPLFALISGAVFFLLIFLIKGAVSPVMILSWGLIAVYSFFNSYPEQIVFFGIIPRALKGSNKKWNPFLIKTIGILIFALFHWSLGRHWLTLIIYIPLGYLFAWVRDRYSPMINGKKVYTHFADAGVHFAWNIILFMFGIA